MVEFTFRPCYLSTVRDAIRPVGEQSELRRLLVVVTPFYSGFFRKTSRGRATSPQFVPEDGCMKRSLVCVLALVVLMATVGLSAQQSAAKDEAARDAELAPQSPDAQPEPPALGIHWAKGSVNPNRPAKPGGGTSPLMLWHNGAIMTDSAVKVIYWGTSLTNSSFFRPKIPRLP